MARRPYERLEDESDPAWEAFKAYRDLALGRTQRQVATALEKSTTLIARWSSDHNWRKRTHAYDMEMDRRKLIGDLKGVEDMRRRQVKLGQDLQELGGIELRKMLAEARKRQKAGTLEQGLVMKLIDLGSKLERVNRGQPGEIIQNTSGDALDLSKLSIEELRMYRNVNRKMQAQPEVSPPAPEPESGEPLH